MARLTPFALVLLLTGCGVSPSPTLPAPAQSEFLGGGGGAAGDEPALVESSEDPPRAAVIATPSPSTAPVAASPSASPTPSPSATPRADDDDDDGEDAPAPTPTPTPTASPTPSPSPSATASPEARTLTVDSSQHSVLYGDSSYLGGPLVVSRIEKTAFDNTTSGHPFRALAGIDIGRYGWTYKRVETLDDANSWTADVGNPGSVCFLDSTDGMTDNSGSWMVYQKAGDIEDNREIRASEHVTRWSPSQTAYMDLGPERTWTVSLNNIRGGELQYSFPGVFLVYSHPDGGRDFRIITGQAQTIRTRGYVYAFYLTDGHNTPDQADRLTFR